MSYTIDQFGPSDLLSSKKLETRRIKVSEGDTCFYEGRQFYTFKEFDIPNNSSETIKVVAQGDTIVQQFGASLLIGGLRIELVVGGTEQSAFTGSLPTLQANNTSIAPDRDATVSFDNGGDHTGGDVVDLILMDAGSDRGNRQPTQSNATEDLLLGFAAGTFYIRLTNTGNEDCQGVFRARWEEL